MSDTPIIGAFCYEDSLIINRLRDGNEKLRQQCATLRAENDSLQRQLKEMRDHRNDLLDEIWSKE